MVAMCCWHFNIVVFAIFGRVNDAFCVANESMANIKLILRTVW
jgi:hypothetical protein